MANGRTFKTMGDFCKRIYTFNSMEEFTLFKKKLNNFFKDSVSILSSGSISEEEIRLIKIDTDNKDISESLNLKPGSLFMITKEDMLRKQADQKNMRVILTPPTQEDLIKKKSNSRWSPEEEALIWDGPAEEVANCLNRTIGSIYAKRKEYKDNNPDFIAPPEAKSHTKSDRKPGTKNKPKTLPAPQPGSKIISVATTTPNTKEEVVEKNVESKKAVDEGFTFKLNGNNVTLPSKPKKIKAGDIEIEF